MTAPSVAAARRPDFRAVLLAGVGYAAVGVITAVLAGTAGSDLGVKAWRWAAWIISAVILMLHVVHVHRRSGGAPVRDAAEVALGAALGGLLLALAGPVRSYWGMPNSARAMWSVIVWPLLLAVPSFVVATILGYSLRGARKP